MEARLSRCAMVTHWLPHTLVQFLFCLVLVYKKVWCSLSSLSMQTGVLVVTLRIILICFPTFCILRHGLFLKNLSSLAC